MKKYVKPELIYESFELSQRIAACDFNSENSNTDVLSCAFTGPGPFGGVMTVFNDLSICVDGSLEGYCEYVSTPMYTLFNS